MASQARNAPYRLWKHSKHPGGLRVHGVDGWRRRGEPGEIAADTERGPSGRSCLRWILSSRSQGPEMRKVVSCKEIVKVTDCIETAIISSGKSNL